MTDDALKAFGIGNGLLLIGSSAISLMDLTPLPLDFALGILAASTYAVAGWLAIFTISNFRTPNS